jgi:site-specific recombinase XerD
MRIRPDQARAVLRRINPARVRCGRPLGLRDSAILALSAGGMSAAEIATLRASAVHVITGRVMIAAVRYGDPVLVPMPADLGARLVAWLTDRRLGATDQLVFTAFHGKLSTRGVSAVLDRHLGRRRTRR